VATIRADRQSGLTLVELMIASFLGLIVLLYAGGIYGDISQGFQTRSQAVMNQQDVTLLAGTIGHAVRSGSSYRIYVVPNRGAPADSGNGLAIYDVNGLRTGLMEWNASRSTLVDSLGNPVSGCVLSAIQFKQDAACARMVDFSYTMDNGAGSPVSLQSSASLRN